MCELLGLSAHRAISFSCSLERFAAHGSAHGSNHDGWGVVAYDGRDARIVKEPIPAADSPWVRFIERHGVDSSIVIAHIRHASIGARTYANTHPFCRELGGTVHAFAHNGNLPGIHALLPTQPRFRPIGDTDSEIAFCALLGRMTDAWTHGDRPAIATRLALVAAFAAELRAFGPANFLYADGELVFAHGDRRTQPGGSIAAPGLHLIEREAVPEDASWLACGVEIESGSDPIAIVASVPLTNESWRPLAEGELLVLSSGRVIAP